MKHLHFNTIESTQNYLLNNKELHSSATLVSCDQQSAGIGQHSKKWDSYPSSLCFSFILEPNSVLTLTSLEVSVLLVQFFHKSFNISLKVKWPNDLLTSENKKCGGILLNKVGNGEIIVGVGLNLYEEKPKEKYKFPLGAIFPKSLSIDQNKEGLSKQIYTFILSNRLSSNAVITQWEKSCAHIEKEVQVSVDKSLYIGSFVGLGKNGEAIIQDKSRTHHFYSGSLSF